MSKIDKYNSLLEFIQETKPFSTKVMDMTVEFIHNENIQLEITDELLITQLLGCGYPLNGTNIEEWLAAVISGADYQTVSATLNGSGNYSFRAVSPAALPDPFTFVDFSVGLKTVIFTPLLLAAAVQGSDPGDYPYYVRFKLTGFDDNITTIIGAQFNGTFEILIETPSNVYTSTGLLSLPTTITYIFDAIASTFEVRFDDVVITLSNNTYTPSLMSMEIHIVEQFTVIGDVGKTIGGTLITNAPDMVDLGEFTNSETDICGEVIEAPPPLTGWQLEGNYFPFNNTFTERVATLTDTLFAVSYSDLGDSKQYLETYFWNGTTFSVIGNRLEISIAIANTAITALNSTTVAIANVGTDTLTTYSWDGNDWTMVGSSLTITMSAAALATINSNTIAFADSSADELRTYSWNGSIWTLSGTSLPVTMGGPSLTALSSTLFAFCDITNDQIRTYGYSAGVWTLLGNQLTITPATNQEVTKLTPTSIAYTDPTNNILSVYDWDGSDWIQSGTSITVSYGSRVSLSNINSTEIVIAGSFPNTGLYRYKWYGP